MPLLRVCSIAVVGAAAAILGVGPSPLGAQDPITYQASGGLGFSFSPGHEGGGVGGSLLLEREVVSAGWLGGRLYAGGFISQPASRLCPAEVHPCSVSSQAAVAGAKMRLVIPIPHVGPFVELGGGLSLGSIESRVGVHRGFGAVDEAHSGFMFHIPVSVGLAFGSRHQHDLSLDYFSYPGRDHVTGSFSIGVGFAWR